MTDANWLNSDSYKASVLEVGTKWVVSNEYHTAITDDILKAGEVEVYKLRKDGFLITVTVIYGEGETDEFDINLFFSLFNPKYTVARTVYDKPITVTDGQELVFMPMQNDKATERLIDNLNRYRSQFNKSMAYDYGTQDKAVAYLVCTTCGKFICALKDAKKETVEKARAGNYECGHCAIVTNHKNRKTGFQPEHFLFDELPLMQKMEKKPVGKLDAFLNKEPLSTKVFFWWWVFLAMLSILIPVFSETASIASISAQLGLWLFMILFIATDVTRAKNKISRPYKDL